MFTCSRVKKDLIIQVNLRKLIILTLGVVFGAIFTIWLFWVLALRYEIHRIKGEVSGSMDTVFTENFNQAHSNLLRLEACYAELIHEKEVNKDLAKIISKKDPDEMVLKAQPIPTKNKKR